MKALVLCGGLPQAALIRELKKRGIYTILADMNENVEARRFSDKFYKVSALDVEGITEIAKKENVDFLLTVCADQVLLVQASVSERLGLPCYIDYETAKDVSSKERMKKIFIQNGIPTTEYLIVDKFSVDVAKRMKCPLVVKPTDAYSSRGVRKIFEDNNLKSAIDNALQISREKTAIVEKYIQGKELTVDVYVENSEAHILCISSVDKVPNNDKFVICRTQFPAKINDVIKKEVEENVKKIIRAFKLKNTPLIVQMITNEEGVFVVECCARTGGGEKYRLIEKTTGFNVVKAVVDLTLGGTPRVNRYNFNGNVINDFLYTYKGVFDHLEGFEEAKEDGIISEYFQLKNPGSMCGGTDSSGDRVAYFSIFAATESEAHELEIEANKKIRIVDTNGVDILRHDLIA